MTLKHILESFLVATSPTPRDEENRKERNSHSLLDFLLMLDFRHPRELQSPSAPKSPPKCQIIEPPGASSVSSKRCFRKRRRQQPECVRNASEMRQKCVRNASKWVLFYWEKRNVQNASEMRQNCVTKCVKNARNTFGGEHLLDDIDLLLRVANRKVFSNFCLALWGQGGGPQPPGESSLTSLLGGFQARRAQRPSQA